MANTPLADLLKDVKIDFTSDYGRLPIREDVLVFNPNEAVMKQWEKLHYLQKHLRVIDKYIQHNKGETLNEALKARNIGLSKNVTDKIGNHNNKTGGISMYFLNLQNFFDLEEEKYDKMEGNVSMPGDIQNIVGELRKEREAKRQTRRKVRKLKMRDMKADGKGYLYVEAEEPKVEEKKEAEEKKMEAEAAPVVEAIKKSKKNILVWIAGATIAIAAISYWAGDKK